ncbi:MAG: hypothetical protein BMS9Abin10_0336 [Gammaproteobacteria bacterium]|nr:MAG: hypothetical protein BMS9Abin10_0336 [Gammaproteobacteria bacterium]
MWGNTAAHSHGSACKRHDWLPFLAIIILLVSGCARPGGEAIAAGQQEEAAAGKPPARSLRIIVKFNPVVTDPSAPAYVAALSRDAGATLVYLRPMSGGAHVFVVEGISSADDLTAVIKRLGQRSDVIYVEADRIMRHQRRE